MLKHASLEDIQLITADKIHNLRSIRADLEVTGEKISDQFFKRGRQEQHWYYSSIVKELTPWKKEFILIQELEKEVYEVFER